MTKGEKTRKRLVEMAAYIISEEGLERLTARNLAARSEVSPGLVTRYFPKISTIFPAVIEHVFEEAKIRLEVAKNMPNDEWFIHRIRENFKYFIFERMHHNRCLLYCYVRADFDKEAAKYFNEVVTKSIAEAKNRTLKLALERQLEVSDQEAADYASSYLQRLDGGLNHCGLLFGRQAREEYAKQFIAAEERRLNEFIKHLGTRMVVL